MRHSRVLESNGSKFYMEEKLYRQISKFNVKNLKKKDNNKLFLVCGETGVGKSAFTFQVAAALDPDFSIDNICFTTEETKTGLRTLINKVVIFDEAFRGISGRNSLNKQQKELLGMLYEIRQLNQVVFLVAPSFFRLDEAIAVELADALFYVYKLKSGRRAFRMFNRKKKDALYYRAKKGVKSYNLVPTLFNGTFPKTYVVSEQDYRSKKFTSLHLGGKQEVIKDDTKDREERLWGALVKQSGSYGNAVRVARDMGINLVKGTIQAKIAGNPEVYAKVVGK